MDRRQFIKASVANIGALSATLAFGCASASSSGTPGRKTTSNKAPSSAKSPTGGAPTEKSSPANQATITETITLNSGFDMPKLGIGTWTLSDSVAEESVYCALENGYRLIDTAQYYGNEAGVGRAVRRAIEAGFVTREDVFVTTKVSPSGYADPVSAIEQRFSALGLGYIDLLLIHQPGANDENVYRAMEQAARDGKVRSIGISNYYTPSDLDEVLAFAAIPPAVIQNENHPYNQNTMLEAYARDTCGAYVESWYPLGGRGNTNVLFTDSAIADIAAAYAVSPAQVILRWHVQAGFIAIPGSSNPGHIAENIAIFDFKLTEDEAATLANLDRQQRFERW